MTSARSHAMQATLRDGKRVMIRAVRPEDGEALTKAFARLDRQSVYTRFFTFKGELSAADLAPIEGMDFVSDVMLIATRAGAEGEIVIGSARYVAHDTDDGACAAEVAFTVEEDYQGLGLAGRLMSQLIEIARGCGIARFEADILCSNKAMLAVFDRCGLRMRKNRAGGVVHVTLALDAPA